MRSGSILILAVVFALTGSASGVVVYSGTNYDVEITTPVSVQGLGTGAGSENLVGFTLTVVNSSGNPGFNPQAYGGQPDPNNPGAPNGITGNLHQERSQPGLGLNTPSDDTATGGSTTFATIIDSHFLHLGTEIIFGPGGAPQETYDVNPSTEPSALGLADPLRPFSETSFGDSLTGLFALTGAAGPTWDLAYLVVPDGSSVGFDGILAGGQSGLPEERLTFDFIASAPIPVPAALLPLTLGLGVLGTRIRRG